MQNNIIHTTYLCAIHMHIKEDWNWSKNYEYTILNIQPLIVLSGNIYYLMLKQECVIFTN